MADDIMAALMKYGDAIKVSAQVRSASWSEKIPPSGRVESIRAEEVMVIFGGPSAGNAYPYEVEGVWHPVFARGPRATWTWVPNGSKAAGFADGHKPFLRPAAEEDWPLYEFGRVIDKWGHEVGFRGW